MESENMIIRLKKRHFFIALSLLVCVLFAFALRAEQHASPAFSGESRQLPVIMYHHVTEKKNRAGKYVILRSELERDLEYIKEKGYKTVTVKDLIDYVNGEAVLPEKIIMLTFDDGFESVRELAWELLKENEMSAVLSVVGSITETYTDNADRNINYAYLNWDDLRELDESDEFEIQNHTYDMHNTNSEGRRGLARKKGESAAEYKKVLSEDLLRMQNLLKNMSGITATAVAYPYGSYSKETLDIVKSLGFKASFVCEERINTIMKSNSDSLYDLGRYNRPSGVSTERFFSEIIG